MPSSLTERFINSSMRMVIRTVCRVDSSQLQSIPSRGPGILVTNHTTNFEGPIYYVLLDPREKTALGKMELWENPFTRFLMQVWGVIPVRRGSADRRAMRRVERELDRGRFVGIAPEGTRSTDGTLKRGRPGVAMLAVARRVPIFPMVQWGLRDLPRNIVRARRTDVHIRVGPPFYLRTPDDRTVSVRDLRQMTDEIMYRLALLLPERLRGYYRDISKMTSMFIQPTRVGEEEYDGPER